MRGLFLIALLAAGGAGAALAEPPLGGKAARKEMFDATTSSARMVPQATLSDADMALIKQVAATQPYYGAVAISPSEGLMSEATLAAANFHDLDNARTAALAGCDARRKDGSDPCVIVSEILPEGHEPRMLQLSAAATDGLQSDYRKGRGAKALAISPATGKWAVAKGDGAAEAAVAQCALEAGIGDCRVVVQD
ncbi:5-aminolevulic acid synthase [Actibacterium sp. D379-3]